MSGLDQGTADTPVKRRILAIWPIYLVLVSQAITQWIAFRLDYHPALGEPIIAGVIYQPFAWLGWLPFHASAPTTIRLAALFAAIAVLVGLAATVVTLGKAYRSAKQHASMHGTAHWAAESDIRTAGLLPPAGKPGAGVYCGGWRDPKSGTTYYLRHDGPEHVMALAPTRSGKGVGLVVPTCLSWPHSMIVNDRKGELWNLTAGWRAKEAGNKVLKFNPSSPDIEGHVSFNPLEEIRIGTKTEVGDVQNVTTIIVDPDGKGLDTHWKKTAFAFLNGAVLHELYKAKAAGRTASLYDVLYSITDPSRDISEYYDEMMQNKHDAENLYGLDGLHPVVASEGRTMANKPDDERGSVLSTAISYLGLFRDPIVREHTSNSNFQIMDLMNHESPVTLYMINRDEDSDRMKPLMRLILNQILRVLLRPDIAFDADGRQLPAHKHRLLLMLDEFPSYGKLEVFREQLAYIAGYGIKAYLIAQDIAQLWSSYGRDETITSNTHIRVAYAPNKPETAEWLSKMTGTKTEMKWQVTESGKRFGGLAEGFSRTAHETSRPLLTPDETMRLRAPTKVQIGDRSEITEPGDLLAFVAGHPPILGVQSLFFKDPTFVSRSKIPPPETDRLRGGSVSPAPAEDGAPKSAELAAIWEG